MYKRQEWDQFHNPKDLAIGISTEANELLDIFRFKSEGQMAVSYTHLDVYKRQNNGGAVYLEAGTLIFTGEFPYEKARPVMEAARSASYMHLVLIGVKDTYVQMDEPEEHKIFADFYFNKKVRFVPSLEQVFLTDQIVKISISTGANRQNENRGMKFMQQFADSFSLVLSGDGWVDLTCLLYTSWWYSLITMDCRSAAR